MPYPGPLEAELTAAAERVGDSRRHELQSNVPRELFHYTSAAGAIGIIKSHRIWATDYRFLNDALEVHYARSMFKQIVTERAAGDHSVVVVEFLSRALHTVDFFGQFFDLYVTCFCEMDDLLNQWRVYSPSDTGYSLGFTAGEIGARMGKLAPNQEFYLRRVIYDRDVQVRLMREVIDEAINALDARFRDASVAEANGAIANCCQFVRAEIADYLMCFKDQAFSVEVEWRACAIVGHGDPIDVEFRGGPYGITPYVSLDLSASVGHNSNKLPLCRVTVGPCSDSVNRIVAMDRLLKRYGYGVTKISGSNRSIRT